MYTDTEIEDILKRVIINHLATSGETKILQKFADGYGIDLQKFKEENSEDILFAILKY